jgi:membrane-associated phospholipid phosphatase
VDVAIVRASNEFLGRAPHFDELVVIFARSDLVKGGLLVALLWWFWHEPHQDQSRRRQVIIAIVAAGLAAPLVSRGLCHLLPSRLRPFDTPGLGLAVPYPVHWIERHGSFPSDHAALAFALAIGFFALSSFWVGLAMTAYVTVFVCLPRLYVGMHWPSDLLGGALIGSAFTAFFCLARVRARFAVPAERLLSRSPGLFYAAMFLAAFGLMTRFHDARELGVWASHVLHDEPGGIYVESERRP